MILKALRGVNFMIGKRPKTKDLVLPKNYELISEDEARNIIGE